MNIVTLLGSPRRRDSNAAMAGMFNKTALEKGAAVTLLYLNGKGKP